MIQVHLTRVRDVGRPNEQHFDQGNYQNTVFEALRRLVMAELRYGGSVTHASATELTVQTRIMGCLDTTEFTGNAEQMQPLMQCVQLYQQHCRPSLVVCTELIEMLDILPHGTAASPNFGDLVMPFSICENGLQLCLLLPLGITAEEDLAAGSQLPIDDLLAAIELMQETEGLTLAEVIHETQ